MSNKCKYGTWTRGEDEALLNILGGDDVARAILRGEMKVIVKQSDLFKRVGVAQVSGAQRFCVADRVETANIGWMNDEFKRRFGDRVEENVAAATLAIHRLEKESLDVLILSELGGRAEILLVYLFELMEKQSKGEDGVLLTNGYANIVYVRDANGLLWAVSAYWSSDYRDWYVNTYSVEHPNGWHAGHQFLSRDS